MKAHDVRFVSALHLPWLAGLLATLCAGCELQIDHGRSASAPPRAIVHEGTHELDGDQVLVRCFVRNGGGPGSIYVEVHPPGGGDVQRDSLNLSRGEARMVHFFFPAGSRTDGYRCLEAVPPPPRAQSNGANGTRKPFVVSAEAFMLGVGLFGLLFVVFSLYWIAYGGARRDGRRWAETAHRLGLQLEPFRPGRHHVGLSMKAPSIRQAMVGTRGGLPVRIWVTSHRISFQGGRYYFTHVAVGILPALELGIAVTPVGWLDRMVEVVTGQRDLQVGLAEIDRAYEIRAADPESARRLLRTPSVTEALVAHANADFPPGFDDKSVSGRKKTKTFDVARLSRALDMMVDLSRRLSAARAPKNHSHRSQRL